MRGRGRASRHRLAKVPEMLPMDPRPLPSTSGSTTSGSSDRSSSYQFWILKYFSISRKQSLFVYTMTGYDS